MMVTGLAQVMCLLVTFSCAAAPTPISTQAPASGPDEGMFAIPPEIIDEGIFAIPPEIIDEGIFAIPPEIIDEGIFAIPPKSQWKWDKKNKKGVWETPASKNEAKSSLSIKFRPSLR